MSRKFVCNVTQTGRFRLRPGRWWESTFVVEIEEQLHYIPAPAMGLYLEQGDREPVAVSGNSVYENSDFVWRKARTIDMIRVPAEILEPRYISREDRKKRIADTFDCSASEIADALAARFSPWSNQTTVGVAREDLAAGTVVALDPETGMFHRAGQ